MADRDFYDGLLEEVMKGGRRVILMPPRYGRTMFIRAWEKAIREQREAESSNAPTEMGGE